MNDDANNELIVDVEDPGTSTRGKSSEQDIDQRRATTHISPSQGYHLIFSKLVLSIEKSSAHCLYPVIVTFPDLPALGPISQMVLGFRIVPNEECMKSSGVVIKDIEQKAMTKEMNCYLKCMMEHHGLLDTKGNIVSAALDDHVGMDHEFEISETEKAQIKQCITKVQKILNCEDMEKLYTCLPKMN
ncbi:unnamed protein product [Phaedon cochleariae]|uniref:Uncharacterized protein n=1 Tax=Phaedon cochleariae TaxID=80249 RepID=A0A9N9X3D9_PHACE|nr:unnamed protein product [Phaedon cochleariae]